MNDKHVHEWHFITDSTGSKPLMMKLVQWWGCKHCDEVMPPEEAERRLNATERLSAIQGRILAGLVVHGHPWNVPQTGAQLAAIAYASALEGA